MENEIFSRSFVREVKEKVPQKELVTMLMDLLFIEKEAIYRRLRGDVPFTMLETAKIAKKLNISIDNLIGCSSKKSRPFQMKLNKPDNGNDDDFRLQKKFLDLIKVARNGEYSEFGFATSIFPLHFSNYYESIERFYILRWLYQFETPGGNISYDSIRISEKKFLLNQEFIQAVTHVQYTYFIWDKLVIFNLVNDILYFHAIHLINEKDLNWLEEEVHNLINHMEDLCIRGEFENGHKIDMYISNLTFETTYTYFETSDFLLTLIKTFTLNETVSFDDTVFQKMKLWMQTLKRTSTVISGSNEIGRIQFFEQQRKLVDKMFHKDYNPDTSFLI